MRKVGLHEFTALIEQAISKSVSACMPRNWDEDYISRKWLDDARDLSGQIRVEDIATPRIAVSWDGFKATGKLETNTGDIAFLIRCSFPSGRQVTGVAHLEAKRIYPDQTYRALEFPQLALHQSLTSSHHVLLYETESINAWASLDVLGYCRECYPAPFNDVRAAVVPTYHVISMGVKSRQLNNFSVPLAYQMCRRFFRGLDLDWSEKAVQRVAAGVPGGANYLVVADVSLGSEREPNLETIEFDRGHYGNLNEEQPRPRGPRR